MIPLLAVAAALVGGYGLARRLGETGSFARTLPAALVWGLALTGACLPLAACLGVRWGAVLVLAPACAGLVGLRRQRSALVSAPAHPGVLPLLAVAATGVQVALLATTPAFGWDFRFIWGVRARAALAVGGIPWQWLQWPPHAFAHPDYPPLWSVLLATGALGDAPVAWAAAAWQAALCAGLAAVCWSAAAGAPHWVRAAAALGGAWAPWLWSSRVDSSGYAEPLVAFLAAFALVRLWRRDGGIASLCAACCLLASSKHEGMVLALGVGVAAAVSLRGRARWAPLAGAVATTLAWRLVVSVAQLPGEAIVLDPARMLARLPALPGAVAAVLTPLSAVLLLAWLAAVAGLAGHGRSTLAAVTGWAVALVAAYLVSPHDLAWHVSTSLLRVLAAPLPAVVALALASAWRSDVDEAAGARLT